MFGVNLIAYTLFMQNIKTLALKFKFDYRKSISNILKTLPSSQYANV